MERSRRSQFVALAAAGPGRPWTSSRDRASRRCASAPEGAFARTTAEGPGAPPLLDPQGLARRRWRDLRTSALGWRTLPGVAALAGRPIGSVDGAALPAVLAVPVQAQDGGVVAERVPVDVEDAVGEVPEPPRAGAAPGCRDRRRAGRGRQRCARACRRSRGRAGRPARRARRLRRYEVSANKPNGRSTGSSTAVTSAPGPGTARHGRR